MSLVGKKVVIRVAEPWDFESEAGANLLNGVIIQSSGPKSESQWLLCEISPFKTRNAVIKRVVLVKRYANELVIDALNAGKQAGCNCVYATDSENDSDVDALLQNESAGFLAGSAELVG